MPPPLLIVSTTTLGKPFKKLVFGCVNNDGVFVIFFFLIVTCLFNHIYVCDFFFFPCLFGLGRNYVTVATNEILGKNLVIFNL